MMMVQMISVQQADYIEALCWDIERELAPGALEDLTAADADEMIQNLEEKLQNIT